MKPLAAGAFAILAGLAAVACTIKDSATPALSGPSTFGVSVSVIATPDAINQDGGSQSAIKVIVRGPDGKGLSGVAIRMDMQINNVPQDFGTLSARSLVTGSDGVANVVYTAPAQTVNIQTPTCNSLPGQCVDIVATASGTDFASVSSNFARIRLVPLGVILPPGDAPTASLQFSPGSPVVAQDITFDGTASCGGPVVGGTCQSSNQIVRWDWNFGDGDTAAGATVRHNYQNAATFTVTLTVTNDRGVTGSATKSVTVSTSAAPTADFIVSPATIHAGDALTGTPVNFNASTSKPGPNRTIVNWAWDFGDGTSAVGTPTPPAKTYLLPNTYTVVLTVTDDAGVKATTSKTVVVVP